MPTVTIVQRALPHYRVPFFEGLRAWLAERGVRLRLVYGKPAGAEAKKQDQARLPWAEEVTLWHGLGGRLVYHPVLRSLLKEDAVISEQANRNLINYLLLAARGAGGPKFAFWGHGRNLQAGQNSVGNRFKAALAGRADWWFAYTRGVAERLAADGIPHERITAVQNSIDTKGFAAQIQAVRQEQIDALRGKLQVTGPAALYCGGMYAEKQIPFLLEAADLLQVALPNFSLIAVGAGPERHLFDEATRSRPWLHVLGPLFGHDKAVAFRSADVLVMPGLVGLGVLDAFVARCPMVTTQYPYHSPEIEYLQDGYNGLITAYSAVAYAQGLTTLLQNGPQLAQLRAGCAASAQLYSMENMVQNFGEGILAMLTKSSKY